MEELFKLANLSRLAATSTFGLKVNAIKSDVKGKIIDVGGEGDKGGGYSESKEESKKIFIPIIVNGYRMTGHLDSGSDVSIMQFSLYLKLKKATKGSIENIQKSSVKNLTSFSGNSIPVKGQCHVNLKFTKDFPASRFRLYIIDDIDSTPPLLLGDDLLLGYLGTVSYESSALSPYPVVSFKKPIFVETKTIYEKLSLMYSVSTEVKLKPFQKKAVNFYLNPAAPVLRTDVILISPIYLGTVSIIPSRTEISFDEKSQTYYGTALVINTSNKHVNKLIVGRYESVNKHKVIRVNPHSYSLLKSALESNPLGREVLPSIESHETNIPIFSLSSSELEPPISMNINDIDETALYSKNPSYYGEAVIDNDTFDPKGIEIPTQIYSNAQVSRVCILTLSGCR